MPVAPTLWLGHASGEVHALQLRAIIHISVTIEKGP